MSHAHPPAHSGAAVAIRKITPFDPEAGIVLTTEAASLDGRLDDAHSAYHDNRSPPLIWEQVEGAQGYAIIVEDPDAPRELPFVHWMIWNIPGEATSLPQGLPTTPHLGLIGGAVQGRNDMGDHGYYGPRPPVGHGVHRYYFQIFAQAARLEMGPETPLAALVDALKGATLAAGELVVTYEAPAA